MELPNLDSWRRWRKEGFNRLPVVRVERGASRPSTWANVTDGVATVLLESAQAGRYTFICGALERIIVGQSDGAQIWSGDYTVITEERMGAPLAVLNALLSEPKAPKLRHWPSMTGGLMGVLGYDLVRTWERLPYSARRDLTVPLYAMVEPSELYIFDHRDATLGIVVWCDLSSNNTELGQTFRLAEEAVNRAWTRWQMGTASHQRKAVVRTLDIGGTTPSVSSLSGEAFQSAVNRVKEYIAAGDTYQVNLSLRTSRITAIPPLEIYEALRRVNPSPYMGLLQLPAFALVCGSPELLVRLENGVVSSRPIAGTRPRGAVAAEDQNFSAELFASEKERAEHLMLVDLIRNDIGRVAGFGTVHVSEFMALEQYSHVMHIVSQVEGRLADGRTWVDVFQSMFPGGTITGCPKIRTMEIIEELEPVGRGYYTGALGWISYSGEMEMNIVIRSMVVQNGVAHVQAGAGIVADSQPAHELDEALRKAEALWVALNEATISHG